MKEIGTFIWKSNKKRDIISVIFCNDLGNIIYRRINRKSKKKLKISWKLLEDDFERREPEPDIDRDFIARLFRQFDKRLNIGTTIIPEHYESGNWTNSSR